MATTTSPRTSSRATARRDSAMTAGQAFALVAGLVYLAIGIAGWFETEEFYGIDRDAELLGFPVNGLHNVVHLALGLVWLGAAMRPAAARMVNTVFGVTLIAVALIGMTEALDELLNIRESTDPDNWLHLGTGALSLFFGLWALPRGRARTARSS